MFDPNVFEVTTSMILFTMLLYSIAIIRVFKTYPSWPVKVETERNHLFWLLFFILFAVTYTVGADFFHYKSAIIDGHYLGLEKTYQYIIEAVSQNYLLFRIIVFGGAVLLCDIVFKLNNVDRLESLLLLLVLFGTVFSYARASLAFTIYYLGVSLILDGKNHKSSSTFWPVISGICLVICSFFFHRSMAILIAIAPLFFVKIKKSTIIAFLVIIPILVFYINEISDAFLVSLSFDESIGDKLTYYQEQEASLSNWKGIIGNIIFPLGLYVICFFNISKSFANKAIRSLLPDSLKSMYFFLIVLIFASLVLYVFSGTYVIFIRYLRMTIIPFVILISYLYKHNYLSSRHMEFILLFAGAGKYLDFISCLM